MECIITQKPPQIVHSFLQLITYYLLTMYYVPALVCDSEHSPCPLKTYILTGHQWQINSE